MLAERPFVSRPVAPETLEDVDLKGVLDYWRSRKGDRPYPLRADILPEDMAPYLHRLALLEVSFEPPFFRFRLVGGTAQLVLGHHLVGKATDAVEPRAHAAALGDLCKASVLQERPECREMSIKQGLRRFTYRVIGLPISIDGQRVDRLLLSLSWPDDQLPLFVSNGASGSGF